MRVSIDRVTAPKPLSSEKRLSELHRIAVSQNSGPRRRGKSVATADRRNLQVQRRMLRMPALIHHVQRSLMALQNGDQRRSRMMALAEVSAKSALTTMKMFHAASLYLGLSRERRWMLPPAAAAPSI